MPANKRKHATVALLVWVTALAGGTGARALALEPAASQGPPPDSGIAGKVVIAPTCPVERPGMICQRPYQATITIRRQSTHTLVGHVRSSDQGRFRIALTPGTYLLVPQNGRPYPRGSSQTVTVHAHRYTSVVIRYDSGIR